MSFGYNTPHDDQVVELRQRTMGRMEEGIR